MHKASRHSYIAMPLPIERSQGNVASLVSRFQTAADRDRESAARAAQAALRRSSASSIASIASRRDSASQGLVTPNLTPNLGSLGGAFAGPAVDGAPDGKGGKSRTSAGSADEATEELDDDGATPRAARVQRSAPADGVGVGKRLFSAHTADNAHPRESAIEVYVDAAPANAAAAGDAGERTAGPAKKAIVTKASPSSATVTARPAHSSNAGTPSAVSDSPAPSPRTRTSPSSTKTPSKPATAAPAAAKPASTTPRTADASRPVTKSSTPRVTTPAARLAAHLVPAHTGPARASPAQAPAAAAASPLRPQATGTPGKPTASSLAKARSPEAPSPPASLGRSARARPSLGPALAGTPTRSAGTGTPTQTPAPLTQTTATPTGSRLLQGTAASRARAAAAAAESPDKRGTPSRHAGTPGAAKTGPVASPRPQASSARTPSKTEPAKAPVVSVGRSKIGRVGLAGARRKREGSEQTTGAETERSGTGEGAAGQADAAAATHSSSEADVNGHDTTKVLKADSDENTLGTRATRGTDETRKACETVGPGLEEHGAIDAAGANRNDNDAHVEEVAGSGEPAAAHQVAHDAGDDANDAGKLMTESQTAGSNVRQTAQAGHAREASAQSKESGESVESIPDLAD
ncbi:hypothetical protein Q5752_002198 [Cryptotrichosporon argae]